METAILEARADLGWARVPDNCPPEFRARIATKREERLKRITARSTPAAPAVVPQRIGDAERTALAARLSNSIKLF